MKKINVFNINYVFSETLNKEGVCNDYRDKFIFHKDLNWFILHDLTFLHSRINVNPFTLRAFVVESNSSLFKQVFFTFNTREMNTTLYDSVEDVISVNFAEML